MARETLEEAIALLGWSKARLARAVYVATHEDDDPDAIARLEQRIKKAFQRPSTKPERFEHYLRIVQADPEYARLGRVVPRHVAGDVLGPEMLAGLARVSGEISRQLVADECSRNAGEQRAWTNGFDDASRST